MQFTSLRPFPRSLSVCLSVYLRVSLSCVTLYFCTLVCLPVSLPSRLSTCLSVCMLTYLRTCKRQVTDLCVYMFVRLFRVVINIVSQYIIFISFPSGNNDDCIGEKVELRSDKES